MEKGCVELPPGWQIEFLHRYCPRCGLDLTQQMPEAGGDQREAEQIKSNPGDAMTARMPGDFEVEVEARLQRMVAPLTEPEKERAQRNEQRWLDGQVWQQTGGGEHEHGKACGHQHLAPVVEGKFFKWVRHAREFITRTAK